MIHVSETLTVHSVEGFLTNEETAELTIVMDVLLGRDGAECYDSARQNTLHAIPGHTLAEAMAVYEPAGRVEVTELPRRAEAILAHASERALPTIRRVMPSITSWRPWTYVEYGPGQHITAHADGIAPAPGSWPRQIAGISVVLASACRGGGFYVDTTGSDALWATHLPDSGQGYAAAMSLAHDGADNSSPWFRAMPRTRWTVHPGPGTALLYGSQLIHGTDPVIHGRERKVISWLIAEPEEASTSADQ